VSSRRVYLPCTPRGLRYVVAAGGVGPAPLLGHAATGTAPGGSSRAATGEDEESEYAAASAAAQSCLRLLADEEPARRIVLAVDVPTARALHDEALTDSDADLVEVDEVVPWRRVAAVLADSAHAEPAVAAARDARRSGSPDAAALAERCLEHELGWWATQEVDVLIAEVTGG
jgi:hypothetical protein